MPKALTIPSASPRLTSRLILRPSYPFPLCLLSLSPPRVSAFPDALRGFLAGYASPLQFYRGTAQFYYRDMSDQNVVGRSAFFDAGATPWVQGDMHVMNMVRVGVCVLGCGHEHGVWVQVDMRVMKVVEGKPLFYPLRHRAGAGFE